MNRFIITENYKINYTLTYKSVKNINLRIKPNGDILVSAPHCVDIKKIDDFINSKSELINSTLKKFESRQENNRFSKRYVSGESFRFLGKNLMLKIKQGDKDKIYRDGNFLYLITKNPDNFEKKEKLINKWYSEQRTNIYNEIAINVHKEFVKYDIKFPTIKSRKMTTRWGSCQPIKNIVTINSNLIEYPRDCIEYVIMHEFCHFIHQNHSKDFYSLLQIMMPNWKEKKKILESGSCF